MTPVQPARIPNQFTRLAKKLTSVSTKTKPQTRRLHSSDTFLRNTDHLGRGFALKTQIPLVIVRMPLSRGRCKLLLHLSHVDNNATFLKCSRIVRNLRTTRTHRATSKLAPRPAPPPDGRSSGVCHTFHFIESQQTLSLDHNMCPAHPPFPTDAPQSVDFPKGTHEQKPDTHETDFRQQRLCVCVSLRLLFPKMKVAMSLKKQAPVNPQPRAAVHPIQTL